MVRSDRELDAPLPPDAESLDAVVIVLWYHDSIWVGADRDKMNKAVFDSLRRGGQYVVVDHSALEGHGQSDVKTLHRIDELSVIREVDRAGFMHTADADFLRNPADTRDWSDSPRNQRSLRGEIREALTRGRLEDMQLHGGSGRRRVRRRAMRRFIGVTFVRGRVGLGSQSVIARTLPPCRRRSATSWS